MHPLQLQAMVIVEAVVNAPLFAVAAAPSGVGTPTHIPHPLLLHALVFTLSLHLGPYALRYSDSETNLWRRSTALCW